MSFSTEETRKARKSHRCCACSKMVEVGTRYVRWVGTEDGFQSEAYHTDCRAAEIAYNRLAGVDYYDWYSLADIEDEDFDWLCDEFPDVAARFGWSMFDWREPELSWRWGASDFVWQTPMLRPVQEQVA